MEDVTQMKREGTRPPSLSRRALLVRMAGLAGLATAVPLLAACSQAAPAPAPTAPAAAPQPTRPAATTVPAAPTTAPAATQAPKPAPTTAPTTAPAVATRAAIAPKGEIIVAHSETVNTMDPQMHTNISNTNVNLLIFDPLIWRNPRTDQLEPMLATSWEPADERTWKLTLRKGVKFHNGEPFNAASVKYTLERLSDPAVKSPQKSIPPMRVEVKDEYTALVRTEDPFAPMINSLPGVPIMDPKAGTSPDVVNKPVGTGPFKLANWVQGSLIVLDANLDHWAGPPRSQRITWRQIIEPATRIAALEAGEVTFVDNLAPEEKARLEKNARLQVIERTVNEVRHLVINNERKPFSDKRVRWAIAHAINVDSIAKNNMLNSVERAKAPYPPGLFGAQVDLPTRGYDPERAKKLLAEAGVGSGFEAELLYYTGNVYPKDDEVSLAIAADLGKVGIKCRLQALEITTAINRTAKGEFDLCKQGTANTTGDIHPSIFRDYHTPNRPHYSNPAFDKVIDEAMREQKPEKRLALYKQANEVLHEDQPNVWLFWVKNSTGFDKRLKDYHPDSGRLVKLRYAWLES